MSRKGTETCPACRRSMFPGDVVCPACERRVKAAKPELIIDYANRDLKLGDDDYEIRDLKVKIQLCALHNAPVVGRPPRRTRP